jgi:hypothetical protein
MIFLKFHPLNEKKNNEKKLKHEYVYGEQLKIICCIYSKKNYI